MVKQKRKRSDSREYKNGVLGPPFSSALVVLMARLMAAAALTGFCSNPRLRTF